MTRYVKSVMNIAGFGFRSCYVVPFISKRSSLTPCLILPCSPSWSRPRPNHLAIQAFSQYGQVLDVRLVLCLPEVKLIKTRKCVHCR